MGFLEAVSDGCQDNKTAVVVGGVGAVAAIAYYATRRSRYQKKPSSLQLTGGAVAADQVKGQVAAYYDEFNTLERGKGAVLVKSEKVADLVDKFYSLVTDLYEWGWGQSFHFSPKLPNKDWAASEAAHEARLPAVMGLGPGKVALDVGCGVGGPMRTVAATSGGNVVGITINEYQVQRATYHNEKQGLAGQCKAVRGNFLDMPFEAASFDGAYAIEATCHAPTLEQVYSEVYRCLKPGSIFVTYEWVSTKLFDASNTAHVAIMDEIIIGNGLPDMRTYKQAEEAGKNVGFQLLQSRDVALASPGAVGMWYTRLGVNPRIFKVFAHFNGAIVNVMEFLRLAPKGMGQIHTMLLDTAIAIIEGGQQGIFTPMHMLVFQKPHDAPAAAPAAAPKPAAAKKAAAPKPVAPKAAAAAPKAAAAPAPASSSTDA